MASREQQGTVVDAKAPIIAHQTQARPHLSRWHHIGVGDRLHHSRILRECHRLVWLFGCVRGVLWADMLVDDEGGQVMITDEQFKAAVNNAFEKHPELTDRILAGRFGCTVSIIKRWRDGTTTPHQAVKRYIVAYLEGLDKDNQ